MSQVQCKICKSEFYAKPNWLRRGWGKYCSKKCQFEGQKKGKIIPCFICNREVYKSQKDLVRSKSGRNFCSKSCQTIWRNSLVYIEEKHPNWKGGTTAYKSIISRSKVPQICKRCRENDKRVLAVHHLDENRNNNKLNNLVWLCHNCHHLIHRYKPEKKKFMVTIV